MRKRTATTTILAVAAAAVLAACGGGEGASRSPSPSTPAAVHTAKAGEPALIQVAGYQYQDPSDPSIAEGMTEGLKQANAAIPGTYTGGAVHEVVKDDAGQILIMEAQLGPTMAKAIGESISAATGAVTGMAGAGASVKTETISTQPVASAVVSKDGHQGIAFAWVHDGVSTQVLGEEDQATLTFVRSYLEAAHA